MNIKTTAGVRPDTLTKGDYLYNPKSQAWEPVKDAYWSEKAQRYIVWLGPLGHVMHTYGKGVTVTKRNYYS